MWVPLKHVSPTPNNPIILLPLNSPQIPTLLAESHSSPSEGHLGHFRTWDPRVLVPLLIKHVSPTPAR